jgi:hypothetical protein
MCHEAADAQAIPAHHQPITVLDFVNPERAGRRSHRLRRHAKVQMKPEGRCKNHGRRIAQQPRDHQLCAAAAGSLVQIDVVNRALYQFAQAITASRRPER